MAVDQSSLQQFIQNAQGTHTAGQAVVPTGAYEGNPNTAYNQPVTKTSPLGVDPQAAALLATIPPPVQNEHANRILNRLFSGGGNWGTPANNGPGTGTGTGPGNGLPVKPNPGNPGPPSGSYVPPGGTSGPRPVGPISGPINSNPNDWSGNFNNAQPNTNLNDSGLGRTQAMDWLRMQANSSASPGNRFNGILGNKPGGGQRGGANQPTNETGTGVWNTISNFFGNIGAELQSELSSFMSDISGQNGGSGVLRQVLNGIVPGLGQLIPDRPLSSQERAALENTMNQQLQQAINNMDAETRQRLASEANNLLDTSIREAGSAAAREVLGQNVRTSRPGVTYEESLRLAEEMYNSAPEMTAAQWRQAQDSMAWNNLWGGRAQNRPAPGSTRQPTVGLPAVDMMDDMLNQIAARAVGWDEQMRNRWTRQR